MCFVFPFTYNKGKDPCMMAESLVKMRKTRFDISKGNINGELPLIILSLTLTLGVKVH